MVNITQNAVTNLTRVSRNPMQNMNCRGRVLSVILTENFSHVIMQRM